MTVICLYGPTGCGKTALSLRLAERFAVEIVSVDSAMVYRGMDIGTAKPTIAERAAVPHHLIDIREPWESYSAGAFRSDAARLISDIHNRGRVPLLVGGTMLYFRALWRGLADLPAADADVRLQIDTEAARDGWPAMHARLARIDPPAAARIRPEDRQRIQRALEVHRITGRTISALHAAGASESGHEFLRLALQPDDREELYRHLDQRLLGMLRAGLVEEVRGLMSLPLMSAAAPAMRAVGYRQIWDYLAASVSLADAERLAQQATRHLAKRQLTWMRSESADLLLHAGQAQLDDRAEAFLRAAGVSRRA